MARFRFPSWAGQVFINGTARTADSNGLIELTDAGDIREAAKKGGILDGGAGSAPEWSLDATGTADGLIGPDGTKATGNTAIAAAALAGMNSRFVAPSGDTTGAADVASINAAIAAVSAAGGGRVQLAAGLFYVNAPLVMRTSVILSGESMIGTVLQMAALPSGAKPSYTGTTTYPVTLDYFPLLWNAAPIQWWGIEKLCIDGNNLNVYGMRLQEAYYGFVNSVVVMNCNKRPWTLVRAQAVDLSNCSAYLSLDGVLLYDCTMVKFTACGFERLGGSYSLRVQAPVSTKGSISVDSCWFETQAAPNAPSVGHIAVSGRNHVVENVYMNNAGGGSILGIVCIGTSDTLTFDGISTANAGGAVNGKFNVNHASNVSGATFSSDSSGNFLSGQFTAASVTDNNGNNRYFAGDTTHNIIVDSTWQINSNASTMAVRLNNASTRLELFNSANNYVGVSSGILVLSGNGGARIKPAGGDIEVQPPATHHTYFYDAAGAHSYSTGHLVLGTYHVWVNSAGKLYIKNGVPANDTDGTVVGAQT